MTYLFSATVAPSLIGLELLPQTQQNPVSGIPFWIWILVAVIVIIIGVIWTLWEEGESEKEQARPEVSPEPVEPPEAAPSAVEVGEPAAPLPETGPVPAAEAEAVPVEEPEPTPMPAEAPPPKPDNLRRISGIGPKIMQILNEHGIFTFEQLAATEVSVLEELMEARGWHMANFATWTEQARELAEQKKQKSS